MDEAKNRNSPQAMRQGSTHPRYSPNMNTFCPISFAQSCALVLYIVMLEIIIAPIYVLQFYLGNIKYIFSFF